MTAPLGPQIWKETVENMTLGGYEMTQIISHSPDSPRLLAQKPGDWPRTHSPAPYVIGAGGRVGRMVAKHEVKDLGRGDSIKAIPKEYILPDVEVLERLSRGDSDQSPWMVDDEAGKPADVGTNARCQWTQEVPQ
jgi:hypothetical protein